MKSQSLVIGWRRLLQVILTFTAFANCWATDRQQCCEPPLGGGAPDFDIQFVERNVIRPGHREGHVLDVKVSAERGYVITGGGLTILDLSNPTQLVELGWYNAVARALAIKGNYAFVAIRSGLIVLDVSNAQSIREVGRYPVANPARVSVLSETKLWIALLDRVEILEISEPALPRCVGSLAVNGAAEIAQKGDLIFLVCGGDGYHGNEFWIVDVSDASNPTRLSRIVGKTNWPQTNTSIEGVGVKDNFAFITGWLGEDFGNGEYGLQVLDVSAPEAPRWVARIPAGGPIHFAGSILYAGGSAIDISDPARPAFARSGIPFNGYVAEIVDGFAYLLGAGREGEKTGITVVDVRDFNAKRIVSSWETFPPPAYQDVAVKGDHAFVLKRWYNRGQLEVFDITERLKPRSVATVEIPGDPIRMTVGDQLAAVWWWSETQAGTVVSIIDLSTPSAPRRRSDFPVTDVLKPGPIKGNYVYYMSAEKGLGIIDASDPASPRVAGYWMIDGDKVISGVGEHLYVQSVGKGLQIVDLAEPTNPRMAAAYGGGPEIVLNAAGSGNYATVGGRWDDATLAPTEILDVSNPLLPIRVGFYDGFRPNAGFGSWTGLSRLQPAGSVWFAVETWLFVDGAMGITLYKLVALGMTTTGQAQRIGIYESAAADPWDTSEWFNGGLAMKDEAAIYVTAGLSFKALEPVRIPRLNVRQIQNEIEISWTGEIAGFKAQERLGMGMDSSWRDIEAAPLLNEGRYSVRVNNSGQNAFFRLARQ
jgi:hypothetical protein